jgi:hypothetical protein
MFYRERFKIIVLVLTGAAISLFVLPVLTAHAEESRCSIGPTCSTCYDQCQDGIQCSAWVCSDGTSGSGCVKCYFAKVQPGNYQKRDVQLEKEDKVLLAQLLSKDPEISQALRFLK